MSAACSPEDVSTAIQSYYTFLSEILGAIPTETIQRPPSEGWPSITETSLAGLDKTPQVISVLKHIPYIKPNWKTNSNIAYDTSAIDYTDTYNQTSIAKRQLEGVLSPVGAGTIPPHVAVLTCGARYGSWLLLDTEHGTITDFIQQERPARETPSRDSPDFWRAYETQPITDFFAKWEANFRSLEWVVNPFNVDDGMMLRHDGETDEVRRIYREHGWPDEFRKEECLAALRRWHDGH